MAILLRLALVILGTNMVVVSVGLYSGQGMEMAVDLHVYFEAGKPQSLVLHEPYHNIRLSFAAPPCLNQYLLGSERQNFESLTDFYAWEAGRRFTVLPQQALAILQCRPDLQISRAQMTETIRTAARP
jgi:hypothetical protein